MKKILALVLALVLALTAVVALAAPSPDNPGGKVTPGGGGTGGNTGTVTPEDEKTDVEVADAEAAEEAIEEAKTATQLVAVDDSDFTKDIKQELIDNKDDVLSVLPEEIQEELKKEGLTAVNEMVTAKFPKGLDSKNLTFKVSFQTPYKAGERVAMLIAVPGKDGKVEWISVTGTATGEGEIVFTIDESTYNKVAGEEVVLVPASEPAK